MKLPLSRIAEFLAAEGAFNREALAEGYSIDSRTLRPGELFFAVQGQRLDGHDFVEQSLEKGAVAAVIRRDQLGRYPGETRLLAVSDTLTALQTLATAVRRLWGKTLIGVTGSTGKTTTKEAIAHVLSVRLRVLKSEGNFNNHFGLPLMLLKLNSSSSIPTTAHSITSPSPSKTSSISAGAMFSPPRMIVSSARPSTKTYPRRPGSPSHAVANQPSSEPMDAAGTRRKLARHARRCHPPLPGHRPCPPRADFDLDAWKKEARPSRAEPVRPGRRS